MLELQDSGGKMIVVKAGSSNKITATLKDYAEVAINKASLLTLTMTLKDGTGAIVNSRSAVNIIDANGGYVSSAGVLSLYMNALDNTLIDSTLEQERRIILLTYTWNDGVDSDDQVGMAEYLYVVDKTGDTSYR